MWRPPQSCVSNGPKRYKTSNEHNIARRCAWRGSRSCMSRSISAPLRDDSGIGRAGEVGDYGASDGLAPAAGADQHEQPRTEIPT
jgi:hypothetical protein